MSKKKNNRSTKKSPKQQSPAKQSARRATQQERRQQKIKKAKRDRILLSAGVMATVLAVIVFAVISSRPEAGETEATAWDLPALDSGLDNGTNGRFTLASYEGTPLVANFFASWCTACEAELPAFRAAGEEFDGELEIVFVNSNETGNWRPMAERTGITDQPLLRDINGAGGNGLYRSLGGSGGMPLTVFYDAEGRVLQVDRGALTTETLAGRLQQLYGLGV
jgi:thiol-disulfide isomerase/thioredoxin